MSVATLLLALTYMGCGGGKENHGLANLAYPQATIQALVGQPIPASTPTITGAPTSYSIFPRLPAGLAFNGSNGTIDGTPTAPAAETTYTITAANSYTATTTHLQLFVAGYVPDLRFQWAGAFDTYQWDGFNLTMGTPPNGGGRIIVTYSGVLHWGPLDIASPTGDGWGCGGVGVGFPLVGGTRSSYTADHLAVLDERLDAFLSEGMIITSLDLSVEGFGVVATGPLASASEYSSSRGIVTGLDGLAALGTAQGQQGAVITAVATPGKTYTNAPGTGQVLACWSKRQSDSGVYEVQVVSGTPVELSLLLPALGQLGFVVTAFGAGDQQSYIAVGTRPVGTAIPHIIRVDGPGLPSGPTVYEGFVPIGRMNDLWGSNHYWVFQR